MVEREHEVDLVGERELGDDTHHRTVELASESKPQHPAVSGGDHQQGAMATDFGRPLGFTSHAGRSSAEAAGRRRVDPDVFAPQVSTTFHSQRQRAWASTHLAIAARGTVKNAGDRCFNVVGNCAGSGTK